MFIKLDFYCASKQLQHHNNTTRIAAFRNIKVCETSLSQTDNTAVVSVLNTIISKAGEVPGRVIPTVLRAANKL